MRKSVRTATVLIAHIAVLLAVLYLVFFLICSVKADRTGSDAVDARALYLSQALREHDFSIYEVGKALSDSNSPAREHLFMALDLVIPLLFLASGLLLQIAATHPKRKRAADAQHVNSSQTSKRRHL